MCPNSLIHLSLARTRHAELIRRLGPYHSLGECPGTPLSWVPAIGHLLRWGRPASSHEAVHFAHREAAGITVDLYWTHREFEETFRVDVVDRCSETQFTLHPATGKEAIAAYHHPFAAMTSTGDSAGASAAEDF
jgi:hypothetical protein